MSLFKTTLTGLLGMEHSMNAAGDTGDARTFLAALALGVEVVTMVTIIMALK